VISLRSHVVSVASVFFALAVGVALGGGPLQGHRDSSVVDRASSDRRAATRLEARVAGLRSAETFTDDFATTVAPGLIGDTLRGRMVTVVVLPGADPADVSALARLVGVAGGGVAGTVRVGRPMVDVAAKQLVDELGTQLQGRLPGVHLPDQVGPYERIGSLVGRAVGTERTGGSPVDGAATTILGGLDAAHLMSGDGRLARRGDLMLFVTGAGEGSPQQRTGAGTIVTSLVQAVDSRTGGAVLAGPVGAADADGEITAVRDDARASRTVSTVDTLGHAAGQVVTVMALAGQAAGRTGHYGAEGAADGAMPAVRAMR
jgi:hypothetical protein